MARRLRLRPGRPGGFKRYQSPWYGIGNGIDGKDGSAWGNAGLINGVAADSLQTLTFAQAFLVSLAAGVQQIVINSTAGSVDVVLDQGAGTVTLALQGTAPNWELPVELSAAEGGTDVVVGVSTI